MFGRCRRARSTQLSQIGFHTPRDRIVWWDVVKNLLPRWGTPFHLFPLNGVASGAQLQRNGYVQLKTRPACLIRGQLH